MRWTFDKPRRRIDWSDMRLTGTVGAAACYVASMAVAVVSLTGAQTVVGSALGNSLIIPSYVLACAIGLVAGVVARYLAHRFAPRAPLGTIALSWAGLCLAVFLAGLARMILAPALPHDGVAVVPLASVIESAVWMAPVLVVLPLGAVAGIALGNLGVVEQAHRADAVS